MSYTVRGAMTIGLAVAPKVDACQGVELVATCAAREDGACQTDVSFQHQGVVAFHGVAHLAHTDGAGDVGGAIEVLSTRVDEEQSIADDGRVVFL